MRYGYAIAIARLHDEDEAYSVVGSVIVEFHVASAHWTLVPPGGYNWERLQSAELIPPKPIYGLACHSAVIDAVRKRERRRRQMGAVDVATLGHLASVDTDAAVHDEHSKAQRALGRIPEDWKGKDWFNRYLRGESCSRIAANEGVTEGTVKNAIRRVKAELRRLTDTPAMKPDADGEA